MKKLSTLLIIAVLIMTCLFSSCDLLANFGNITNAANTENATESTTNSNTETTTSSNEPADTPELSMDDFLRALEKWDAYLPFSNKECSCKTTEVMKTLDGEEIHSAESVFEMDSHAIKAHDGVEEFIVYYIKEGNKYYEITKDISTGAWKKEEFTLFEESPAYMMSLAGHAEALRQEISSWIFSCEDGIVTFKHPDYPNEYIYITIENGIIVKWENYGIVEQNGTQYRCVRTVDFFYGDVTVSVPKVS